MLAARHGHAQLPGLGGFAPLVEWPWERSELDRSFRLWGIVTPAAEVLDPPSVGFVGCSPPLWQQACGTPDAFFLGGLDLRRDVWCDHPLVGVSVQLVRVRVVNVDDRYLVLIIVAGRGLVLMN